MYFEKAKSNSKMLKTFYEEYLVPKYTRDDLMNFSILTKFIKSDNMKCVLAVGDNGIVLGGICYTKMQKCDMVFIQYLAAKNDTVLLQTLTVTLLDELTNRCIISTDGVQEAIKKIGFHYINTLFVKPSIAFDRDAKTCRFALYDMADIPKNELIDFMYEYYTKMAFIPKPEINESFMSNMDKISNLSEVIPCTC